MLNIKLKDGSIKEISDGASVYELAASISKNLAKSAVVGEVNGTLVDLRYKLKNDDEVNILTYEDEKAIQLDFQLPQRFELEYMGSDGEKHRPIVIHRVIFGSIERFMGILIEHFAGKFPTWLSPVQVKILPISNKFNNYAENVKKQLSAEGIRIEMDCRDEKIGYKIREARNERVPYMIVVGEKEEKENKISLRSRKNEDEGSLELSELIDRINSEVKNKEL